MGLLNFPTYADDGGEDFGGYVPVSNMEASVRLYREVLGMDLLYSGERSGFSSLRATDAGSAPDFD